MPSARTASYTLTTPGPLRLYSTTELLHMPPPTWLVDHVLPAGGVACVYGPPGSGKSFVALDLALSVASGLPWHGRRTEQGLVVYVSAEGNAGLGIRVRAWFAARQLDLDDADVAWLMEAVPIYATSEQVDVLLERFDELQKNPALVVVDTMARCFDGDENETQDMGNFIAGIDRFRNECGSTVLVIHHTNASEGRERGNTALRGAADTMIRVAPGLPGFTASAKARQGMFTLTCDKQKEALPFETGLGRLVSQSGPTRDTGSAVPSIEWMDGGDE